MATNYGFSGLKNNQSSRQTLPVESNTTERIYNGRVKDIILDSTHPKFYDYGEWNGVGTIEFELASEPNKSNAVNKAIPLMPHLRNYPVVNEFVVILSLPSKFQSARTDTPLQYFYLNPVSCWNHPHHNAVPNPFITSDNINNDPQVSYYQMEGGLSKAPEDLNKELTLNPLSGGTFVEKTNIHPILPFMGDVILEGRFGNSLRFGNTSKSTSTNTGEVNNWSFSGENGDPITILRNGQPTGSSDVGFIPITEDVNKDLSSIYLTSNQQIPLINSDENYSAFKKPPILQREYNKPQIILNSGRLVFNSNVNDIILTSKGKIALAANSTIGISTKNNIVLDSTNIKFGSSSANQPIILGSDFMEQFEQLLIAITNITSALEAQQDWPGGMPVPGAIIPPAASAARNVLESIKNLVTDAKQPLLSSKVRVE